MPQVAPTITYGHFITPSDESRTLPTLGFARRHDHPMAVRKLLAPFAEHASTAKATTAPSSR